MNPFKKLKLWLKNLIDPRGSTYLDSIETLDNEAKWVENEIKRKKKEKKK